MSKIQRRGTQYKSKQIGRAQRADTSGSRAAPKVHSFRTGSVLGKTTKSKQLFLLKTDNFFISKKLC